MKLSLPRIALMAILAANSGCSINDGPELSIDMNNPAMVADNHKKVKNAATLRFTPYADQRKETNPYYLGEIAARVSGIRSNKLTLDQEASTVMTSAIKTRFDAEGYQVLEGDDAMNAKFEISGKITELSLNIRGRDELSIAIETTLTNTSTGKVVWSGLTTETNNRFAGVSGNNKTDVVAYLKNGLRIVSSKTVSAVSTSLQAAHPELFNLTPGSKTISGVDVLVAPPASRPINPASPKADIPPSNITQGTLSVATSPQRAKVYLDGVYFGLSPLHAEIEPGVHDVVVKLKGYKTVTEKVSVRIGDSTEFEASLDR